MPFHQYFFVFCIQNDHYITKLEKEKNIAVIREEHTGARVRKIYEITEQGKEAVELFEFKISDAIKIDIMNYLKEQKIELRNESAISSDYYPSNNEYVAQCSIKERNHTLLEVKLTVPTQEQAIHICDTWRDKSEEIYQYLITQVWQNN